MERICETCGVAFEVTPKQIKYNRGRFCSKTCQFKWFSGANNPGWRGGPVQRVSEQCGKTFEVLPGAAQRGEGRFCSQACYNQRRSGEDNPNWRGGRARRICESCGTPFEVHASTVRYGFGRFCSPACYGKWRATWMGNINNPNWHGGVSYEPYGPEFSAELKQVIRDRDGHLCQLCGKPENGEALAVHHIDYDKTNNQPENLIALCRVCHSKTNTRRKDWTRMFYDLLSTQ